jgi:hypothetical protein
LVEANPKIIRIVGKYREGGISNQLMTNAIFFASVSISFMLLLKGQELMIEAFVWFVGSGNVLKHFRNTLPHPFFFCTI